jgi:hypothetical protein
MSIFRYAAPTDLTMVKPLPPSYSTNPTLFTMKGSICNGIREESTLQTAIEPETHITIDTYLTNILFCLTHQTAQSVHFEAI